MANSLFDLFIRVSAQDTASAVLGKIANNVSSLSGRMANFGLSAAGVQTIASSLSEVSGKFTEYEKDLAAVSAITGQTGNDLKKIGADARQLAKDFGGSASDNLKSFQGILSKFGVEQFKAAPEALAEIARSVNILSAASGDDAAQSMNVLTNSMLQMGINTDNAKIAAKASSEFINMLAASAQVGSAEIPQMGAAILQTGVAAKAANMNFLETNTALQVLGRGGKYGSEAGVSLRNVINLLIKASEPAEAAMAKLGTSSSELGMMLTDPSKGLNAAMKVLKKGMEKLPNDAERAATWAQIFGLENAAAAGILRDNTGTYDEYRKSIGKIALAGAAYSQAAIRMNTSSTMASRAQAYFNDVLISGGAAIGQYGTAAIATFNSVVPTITGIAGVKALIPETAFASVKSGFQSLRETAPRAFLSVANSVGVSFANMQTALVGRLGAMGSAVSNFGTMLKGASLNGIWSSMTSGSARALTALQSGMASGIGTLTQFGSAQLTALRASSLFSGGISGFASTIGGSLMTGLRSAVTGIARMNMAFLTSPVTWIAIAIAGAAYLIYKNWSSISGFFKGLFDGIAGAASGFMDGLSAAFAAPWAILQEVGAAFKPIFDAVSKLFAPIQAVSGAAGGAGKQFAWMRDVGVIAGQYLGTAFRVIATPILYIITLVGQTISIIAGLTTSGSAMAMVLAGAFTAIVAPIQLVMNGVWQLFQFIQAIFSGTSLKEAGVNMIMGLWEGIKATWEKLVGGVKGLVSGFTSLFTGKKEEPAKAAAAPPKPEEKASVPKPQAAPPKTMPPPMIAPPKMKPTVLKVDGMGETLVTGRPVLANAPPKPAIPSRPVAAAPEGDEKVLKAASSYELMRIFGPEAAPKMAAEIFKKTQYDVGKGKTVVGDDNIKITKESSADDIIRYLGTKPAATMSKKLLENKTFVANENAQKVAASAFSEGESAKAKGDAEKQAAKAAAKAARHAAKEESKVAREEEKLAKAVSKKSESEAVPQPSKVQGNQLPNLSSLFSLPQSLGLGEGLNGIMRDIVPPLVQTNAPSFELPTPLAPQAAPQSAKEVVVNFTVNLNIAPSQNSSQSEAQSIAEEVQRALMKMKPELANAVTEALERDKRLQFSSF